MWLFDRIELMNRGEREADDRPQACREKDVNVEDRGKQKISAIQLLSDIRSGMTDALLKEKYGLSDKGVESVYKKLAKAGYLSEEEVLTRSAATGNRDQATVGHSSGPSWECPSCHAPQASEQSECPVCGIVTAKFKARQEDDRSLGEAAANINYTVSSRSGLRMAAVAVIAVIIAGGAFWAWVIFVDKEEPHPAAVGKTRPRQIAPYQPNRNALAIRDRAVLDDLQIELQPLADLDFKSKADVLGIRRQAVTRYPDLIKGAYRPSDAVFGQIVDGLPWWGVLGAYHYGRGNKSIAGPSLHSLSILNPYLLVVPDFNMRRWDPGLLGTIDENTGHQQFYCSPQELRWQPRLGRVHVTYDAACLQRSGTNSFGLYAYNARDFNLRYIFVSYPDSLNILKENEPAGAYANPQFIHQGGSCGYPGGCNNMSPATPPIDNIQIFSWPVRVVIRLWESDPGSVTTPPDVEYVMHFK